MTNMNTVHCAFPGELLSGVCFQAWNRTRSLLVHVSVYFLKTLFKDHSVRLPFVYRCRSRPIFTIIQENGSVSLHWWTVNRKKIRNNDQMVIRKRNQKYKTSRNPNIELLNSDYLSQIEMKTALQLLLRNGSTTLFIHTDSPPLIREHLITPPK